MNDNDSLPITDQRLPRLDNTSPKNAAQERFEERLRTMPLAGFGNGFNDRALPSAVSLAKAAGISQQEAFELIYQTQGRAERETEQEIRRAIEKFYHCDTKHLKSERPAFGERDNAAIKRLIDQQPKATLDVLRDVSPTKDFGEMTPAEFLSELFRGDPLVTLGWKVPRDGEDVGIESETLHVSELKKRPVGECVREYVVPSPSLLKNGRRKDGEASRHSADMYPKRFYLIVEFDKASRDDAAAILLHLKQFAPLVMVVDSAGKSLHGWFDCARASDSVIEKFFSYAVRLGADPKMWDIWQYARLPHGERFQTKARQNVLYWDPGALRAKWEAKLIPGRFVIRSVLDLPEEEDSATTNLLGDRFLSRGKGILLAGPTGIGKSTLTLQAAMLWALGRDFFGLKPQKPLKILILQAENDDQEMRQAVCGVIEGLELTSAEVATVGENLSMLTENSAASEMFSQLGVEIAGRGYDMLVIDPLFAFYKGSVTDQEKMSEFLRRHLQPFLETHRVGCLIVHHTNKPAGTKKDRAEWTAGDFAYAGSGSAELANWSKGVLTIRNKGSRAIFELIVGKRHARAKFVDEQQAPVASLFVKQSSDPTMPFWSRATQEELEAEEETSDNAVKVAESFLKLSNGCIGDVAVKAIADDIGVSKKTVDRLFQGKERVLARAGEKSLVLHRRRGKVSGAERTPEGIKAYIGRSAVLGDPVNN
jgi:hypothetical protein